MENKQKKRPRTIKNNLYMLGKIADISPWYVFNAFLNALIRRAEWAFFTVVFMRYLFGADEITRTFNDIVIFLSATTAALFATFGYCAWYENVFRRRAEQKVTFALSRELFDKAAAADLSCYENPEFYDTYTKAATEASERAQSVLNNCSGLVSITLATLFVIYSIVDINLIAGIFSFLSFIGSFFFGRIENKIRYDRDMERVPDNRRMAYVNRVMYLQQYSKEMRLTDIFGVIIKIYDEALVNVFKIINKYWKKLFAYEVSRRIVCFPLVFQGMWIYAAYLAIVKQSIQVGDFIVLSSAIVSTTWMLRGVRDGIVDSMQDAKYIQNLMDFLSYIPKIDETQSGLPVGPADVLELRNVSFRYAESGRDILKNVNMTVKAGERIALVGHNGAGKTSLVKLIMRLYDPTEGQIFLNGINIREYNLKEYRARIGAAFQDFQIFSLSAAENVLMKRLGGENERSRAVGAMKQSGAYDKIATLDGRENAVLTREFDDNGAVLSGGEYQKLATARAFAKDAHILLLDEPSSALDPIAEHMMYETIMRLCSGEENAGKIAVIISHRLSSAANSDRIYMLENGEVVEYGPHKELLARGGPYAEMYKMQAASYLFEEDSDVCGT